MRMPPALRAGGIESRQRVKARSVAVPVSHATVLDRHVVTIARVDRGDLPYGRCCIAIRHLSPACDDPGRPQTARVVEASAYGQERAARCGSLTRRVVT